MNSIISYFKTPTPEEQARKWRTEIRSQKRGLDRKIRDLSSEEAKVKKSIKDLAKKGDMVNCKSLAKEVARSQRHMQRLHTSKAQLNSIEMQLEHQLATVKITGTLQKSGEVMKLVNSLVSLPEISQSMMEMSKEMTKAGIMDEIVQDTMDTMDDEDIDEEAGEEVDKILLEITQGEIGELGKAMRLAPRPAAHVEEDEEEEEPELDEMKRRLEALKG